MTTPAHQIYAVIVAPVREEDGGGYCCFVPDLTLCQVYGKTREEAAAKIEGAIKTWIDECIRVGARVPNPSTPFVGPGGEIPA